MAKIDIVSMMQNGLGKVSANLMTIEKRLEKIENIISGRNDSSYNKEDANKRPVHNLNPNERLSKAQAAEILGISIRTLDRYRKKGIIPYKQYCEGCTIYFSYKNIIGIRDKIKGENHGRDYFSELISPTNK